MLVLVLEDEVGEGVGSMDSGAGSDHRSSAPYAHVNFT